MKLFDVIVVGGGPAGLSAALGLVRAHRSVLLIDSKQYRNNGAHTMQNVLTLDGVSPSVFRERAWADLSRYPTFSTIDGSATRVTQRDETTLQQHYPLYKLQLDVQLAHNASAEVKAAGGAAPLSDAHESFLTRRLVLANGVKDVLPDIPGMEPAWGDTVHVSADRTHCQAAKRAHCYLRLPHAPLCSSLCSLCRHSDSCAALLVCVLCVPVVLTVTDGRSAAHAGVCSCQAVRRNRCLQARSVPWDQASNCSTYQQAHTRQVLTTLSSLTHVSPRLCSHRLPLVLCARTALIRPSAYHSVH